MNVIRCLLVCLLLLGTRRLDTVCYLFKPPQRSIGAYGNASFDFSALLPSSNLRGSTSVKRDLFARQEGECAYPILCDGGTWCCPDGYQCVSGSASIASLLTLPSVLRFRIAAQMIRIAWQIWRANAVQKRRRLVEDGRVPTQVQNAAATMFVRQACSAMNWVADRTVASQMR